MKDFDFDRRRHVERVNVSEQQEKKSGMCYCGTVDANFAALVTLVLISKDIGRAGVLGNKAFPDGVD